MLGLLTSLRAEFGPAERRLADYILAHSAATTRLTLAQLAQRAGVSEPTVLRLVRKLGGTGFPDFKVRLAAELASGATYLHHDVNFEDSVQDVYYKVMNAGIAHLSRLRDSLNVPLIERAIDALAQAQRIDFFATGQTGVVAMDAQQKFLFLEVPAFYQFDSQLQIMSASVLRPRDVAVCFSFRGQKIDIVRCAQAARAAGATVITVTRSNSPLARAGSIAVPVDVTESLSVYSPIATRLAHLAIVDVFATGVALRRGPGVVDRIRHMKAALDYKVVREEASQEPPLSADRS